ncbi:exonuclease domain-containing protein [Corynebacterium aquilae]|uniref:DNA polymerase III subunit epsilon n=1 Tax=Corynebacterium aquilae DSM 44791 TaxID=1431546 RepID=A0A1L7CFM7_9CORY|nr:exonuclease domain-containing protein [Corynebacterium aquilae]APT84624.1 DNA polymerase III subunit epsilon [Corynebacterium aquilae DSM 44791]
MFGFGKARKTATATGALKDFYAVAAPDKNTPLTQAPLLAVDVETTGLEPGKDHLLSIGWVALNGLSIDAGSAGHVIIDNPDTRDTSVGHSATIHGLTDDALAAGHSPQQALDAFLAALRGRAMLVHYAAMEKGFLSHALKQHYGAGLDVPIVDTFALERRHMERMFTYPRGEDLRLPRVRSRYGLPHYRSHNALTDALACAELYLALVAHGKATTLKPLLI